MGVAVGVDVTVGVNVGVSVNVGVGVAVNRSALARASAVIWIICGLVLEHPERKAKQNRMAEMGK